MDRQAFLSQLLSTENSVQAGEGEECMICKEEYGTASAETGATERQIRLPCNDKHIVGSSCIATWLQENNTCPTCRHEFFGTGHEDIEGEDDEDQELYWDYGYFEGELEEEERQEERETGLLQMQALCRSLCDALGFQATDHPVRDIASHIARRVWYLDSIQEGPSSVDNFNLAAACVYMASHLVRHRLRMRDIARVSPLSRESITAAYRLLDEEEDEIVDWGLCLRIGTRDMNRVLRRLPKSRETREREARERR